MYSMAIWDSKFPSEGYKLELVLLISKEIIVFCEQSYTNQSHYREVPGWEVFMEQELRFGLDLGRLALLKKNIWADYEQLLKPVFSSFN